VSVLKAELLYGDSVLTAELDADSCLGVFQPREVTLGSDEGEVVRQALANPIGAPRLREMAQAGDRVVVVTSDLTRPCPSDRLLPPVLAELAHAGVADEDITIVMALGLHRPMTAAEMERMVGHDVYRRYRVINHDLDDVISLGSTSLATPVAFFRPVVEADLRVCLGNLEFHYFAGFSGGAKAILPGCASRECINANHARMVDPRAAAGRLEDNPVRLDLEEGVDQVGVDFILNAVADGEHRVVAAFAGDVTAAHRAGCAWLAERGTVPVPAQADIVVVGTGGFPKDINIYQAQKALDNAALAVRDGGVIIWVAECREGFGNPIFEEWITRGDSPEAILRRIQEEFVLGGHKAAAIAGVLQRAHLFLLSAMDPEMVRGCGLEPHDNLAAALAAAKERMGLGATTLVMPFGGSTLPVVDDPRVP
jgi:lactate racemase